MLIDIKAVKSEMITPVKYLELTEKEKNNIENAKIVPPVLGAGNFGMVEVTYKTPLYKGFD